MHLAITDELDRALEDPLNLSLVESQVLLKLTTSAQGDVPMTALRAKTFLAQRSTRHLLQEVRQMAGRSHRNSSLRRSRDPGTAAVPPSLVGWGSESHMTVEPPVGASSPMPRSVSVGVLCRRRARAAATASRTVAKATTPGQPVVDQARPARVPNTEEPR